ncbi:MAG TPA: hypothetical protein VEI04_03705 [Syntrophobacteria bacterium]|nr:hypothetical protein [Syntrophobacteria bacterium]
MRLREMQGRRCPWSGIVFICVFVAMVVFIAFEVLDLDGSNLRQPPASTTIAAEPALADVEELLPQSDSVPAAQTGVSLGLDLRLPPEAVKLFCPSGRNGLIARLDQARPRSFLRHETPPPTPLSDDPA